MRLIGFNFDKIHIEKFSDNFENLKINTNISVPKITKINSSFFKTKEQLLEVNFSYTIDYDPKIANIELTGNIVLEVEQKLAEDVLKQWKDKKIAPDFRITLFNVILRKSNLKSLQLEDELNLPPHVLLPILKKEDSQKEPIKD